MRGGAGIELDPPCIVVSHRTGTLQLPMGYGMDYRYAIALCFAFLVVGCTEKSCGPSPSLGKKQEAMPVLPVFELVPRDGSLATSTNAIPIAKMSSNDVIVAVNGYPLTKEMYDAAVTLKQRSLMRDRSLNTFEVAKMSEDFAIEYPRNFMAQRLLVDDAISRGVVTTNEVEEYVDGYIAASAKRQNTTVEEIERRFGSAVKYMKYEQSVAYIMQKLIATNIPPKAVVDDAFVEMVRKNVLIDNEETAASNATKRVRLAELRKQIQNGEISFEKARERFSEIKDEDRPDGTWGEFDIEDEGIKPYAKILFGLNAGEVAEVQEDDENYYIFKVVSIAPGKRGDKAVGIIEPEKRKIARIAVRKIPLFIVQEHEALKRDLMDQMQIRAVDDYVNWLLTNGTSKVVYPNGSRFFQ